MDEAAQAIGHAVERAERAERERLGCGPVAVVFAWTVQRPRHVMCVGRCIVG
mgnify:CR=1 FL=1